MVAGGKYRDRSGRAGLGPTSRLGQTGVQVVRDGLLDIRPHSDSTMTAAGGTVVTGPGRSDRFPGPPLTDRSGPVTAPDRLGPVGLEPPGELGGTGLSWARA